MKKHLSPKETEELIKTLKTRFDKNKNRHNDVAWSKIQIRLEAKPKKLWSLNLMEDTGGEPDVVDYDKDTDKYIFYDCAPESPGGRRSLCYDQQALESRKANKPKSSALTMASEMGIEVLTEEQYIELQKLGEFDTRTSSWIQTSDEVRKLGGAIFGDRRYNRVFTYHNGAESYYAGRGFRGRLSV